MFNLHLMGEKSTPIFTSVGPMDYCFSEKLNPFDYHLVGLNMLKHKHDGDPLELMLEMVPPATEAVFKYQSDEKTLISMAYIGKFRTIQYASAIAMVPKDKLPEYISELDRKSIVLCGLSLAEYLDFMQKAPENYEMLPLHARTNNPVEVIFDTFARQIPGSAEVVLTPSLPTIVNVQQSQFWASFRVVQSLGGDALIPKVRD